jgi:hypothetical protein
VERENNFKPTIGNVSLHQDSNDNGLRIVNFVTSKNLVLKSTLFPHRKIYKYTWTSPDGKTHNQTIRYEIHKLISNSNKEKMPEEWRESIIVPINKKSDKTDCSN